MTQQEFLRDAMKQLGMTRQQLCDRIAVPIKTFDKWLLPTENNDFHNMPKIADKYIREILTAHQNKP